MRRAGWFLVAGMAALALASQAVAGTYDVLTCGAAPNGANHAWRATGAGSAHLELGESCPVNGDPKAGLYVRDRLDAPFAPDGETATWNFVAPADTTIRRWRYARWVGKKGTSWETYARVGNNSVLDNCRPGPGSCEFGVAADQPGSGENDAHDISVDSLSFGIRCAAGGFECATGSLIHRAWAYLYSSIVTLAEDVLPRLDPPQGSLLDAGWRRGTHIVEISGSDDLGLRETRVYVDGEVVAQAARDCDFTYTLPCVDPPCSPDVVGGTCGDGAATAVHTIDTTKLADGRHELRVAVVDAAGNERRSEPRELLVDNTRPRFEMSLPQGATADPAIRLHWAGSDGQGSGVSRLELEVSIDGGPWQPWLTVPRTTTGGTYHATPGHAYRFRGRAIDASGLASDWLTSWEIPVLPAPQPCDCSPRPGTVSPPPGPETGDRGEARPPTRTTRRTPRLAVRTVRRRGSRLMISGTISRTATGRVVVTVTARARGKAYRARGSARVRRGRFRARLRIRPIPARARGRVTIRYGGDATYRARTVRARLSR